MPPRLEQVTHPAPKRARPQRTTRRPPPEIFGPLRRADAPITRAQKLAASRVQRAQRRLPEQALPAIPSLAHPTHAQAEHAMRLSNRAVRKVPVAARGELQQDPRSRARLAPAYRAAGQVAHDLDVRAGLALVHADPGRYGVSDHQLAGLHVAAVNGALPEPVRGQLARIAHRQAASMRSEVKPGGVRHGLGGAADRVSADLSQRAFAGAPNLRLALTPFEVLRAAVEHPTKVIPRTASGAASLAAGALAAPIELGINTVSGAAHGDPLRGVGALIGAAKRDYSRRYGPLLQGDTAAFRRRLVKEGAASEIADIATVAAPEGAVLGRGLGAAARAGALSGRLERFASEARPGLRISGGKVVAQDVSRNLIRLSGQRLEDVVRSRRVASRARKAQQAGTPARGLQPGEGEVVKSTLRGQRRAQAQSVAERSAIGFHRQQREQAREVRQGAQSAIAKLSPPQRAAVFHVVQGLVTPDDPVRAVAQLRQRRAQVLAERNARGLAPAPGTLHTNDELGTIDGLIANADKVFGGKAGARLRAFHEGEVTRAQRVEQGDPGVKAMTAAVRAHRPQGEMLGVEHPYDVAVAKVAAIRERLPEMADVERRATAGLDKAEAALVKARQREAAVEAKSHALASARRRGQRAGRIPTDQPDLTRRQGERLMDAQADRMVAEQAVSRLRAAVPSRREMGRKLDAVSAELERRRPEFDQEYLQRVHAAREAAGLPHAAFVSHRPRPGAGFSDFAPGGARAMQGVHKSEFSLFRAGLADVTPAAYVQSLAHTIKRKHNWSAVADQFEAHALRLDPQRVGKILGRKGKVDVRGLTLHEARKVVDHLGIGPADVGFWNPGRLRAAAHEHADAGLAVEEADHEPVAGLENGVAQGTTDEARLGKLDANQREAFLQTRGWQIVPRGAYDEITASTRPSGLAGRLVDKAQGLQSRILLGTSPAWLQIQIASNAVLSGFGVRGNLPDFAKAMVWWHSLPPEVRDAADDYLGHGVFESHGRRTHLGATVSERNRLVNGWRAFGETAVAQTAKRANPMDLLFRADNAQNEFFKRTVLYSQVKRAAYQRMGETMGPLARGNAQLAGLLSVGPREALHAIVSDPAMLERQAKAVNDLLGDWTTYTAKERRVFKRGALFYGYFRFSLRLLFYTLPVKHPVAAAVAAKLAQLHNSEVNELLGGPGAPWSYGRIYFGKGDRLHSIDVARANPLSNPIVALAQEGPKALAGLQSPLLGALFDQIYGEHAFTGQRFHVHGSAEDNPNPDAVTRGRIFAHDMASLAFPYRELVKATQGAGRQGDDSLLFSARPTHYKSAEAIARNEQRVARAGAMRQQILRDVFPLAFGKPEDPATLTATRRKVPAVVVDHGGGAGAAASSGQQLLERAAERSANGGVSEAQLRLLEQAAQRTAGARP